MASLIKGASWFSWVEEFFLRVSKKIDKPIKLKKLEKKTELTD